MCEPQSNMDLCKEGNAILKSLINTPEWNSFTLENDLGSNWTQASRVITDVKTAVLRAMIEGAKQVRFMIKSYNVAEETLTKKRMQIG